MNDWNLLYGGWRAARVEIDFNIQNLQKRKKSEKVVRKNNDSVDKL